MGGTGDIGGGSCNISFTIKDNASADVCTLGGEDTSIARGQPVEVTVTFPDGFTKTATLRNRTERVHFEWKRPGP